MATGNSKVPIVGNTMVANTMVIGVRSQCYGMPLSILPYHGTIGMVTTIGNVTSQRHCSGTRVRTLPWYVHVYHGTIGTLGTYHYTIGTISGTSTMVPGTYTCTRYYEYHMHGAKWYHGTRVPWYSLVL
jgi:hypothetical protein